MSILLSYGTKRGTLQFCRESVASCVAVTDLIIVGLGPHYSQNQVVPTLPHKSTLYGQNRIFSRDSLFLVNLKVAGLTLRSRCARPVRTTYPSKIFLTTPISSVQKNGVNTTPKTPPRKIVSRKRPGRIPGMQEARKEILRDVMVVESHIKGDSTIYFR